MRDYNQDYLDRFNLVDEAFNRESLALVCGMHETEFGTVFGMDRVAVKQQAPANYYYFKDNGSQVLAVAHLDTVVDHCDRPATFVQTADGEVVFSGALDDRLGAYIILILLPMLGIKYDVLLTVGEEMGMSTAAFFEAPKDYHYMIEFDRGGTDVVMYQYEDAQTKQLVRDCGARVGSGSFSDISYLEHIEVKGFNWGVGYQDYHGPRSHAFLDDTFEMLAYYLDFHASNYDEYMPHEKTVSFRDETWSGGKYRWSSHHWPETTSLGSDAWLEEGEDDTFCFRHGVDIDVEVPCEECEFERDLEAQADKFMASGNG